MEERLLRQLGNAVEHVEEGKRLRQLFHPQHIAMGAPLTGAPQSCTLSSASHCRRAISAQSIAVRRLLSSPSLTESWTSGSCQQC